MANNNRGKSPSQEIKGDNVIFCLFAIHPDSMKSRIQDETLHDKQMKRGLSSSSVVCLTEAVTALTWISDRRAQ
ncbi:hypothetical protein INR49_001966, partial [Caranx melampygus]